MHGVLLGLANDARKVIRTELPDAAATLSFFANLGEPVEIEYLMWTLDRVAERGAEIPRQVAAWMVGDGSVVEQQVMETRTKYPGLYQSLLADRNRAWVPRIDAMLDEPGSVFVLVGDSHLAGDDGIPALLTRSGLEPQRAACSIAVRSRRGSRRGGAPADDGGASRAVSSTPAKCSPVARGPVASGDVP